MAHGTCLATRQRLYEQGKAATRRGSCHLSHGLDSQLTPRALHFQEIRPAVPLGRFLGIPTCSVTSVPVRRRAQLLLGEKPCEFVGSKVNIVYIRGKGKGHRHPTWGPYFVRSRSKSKSPTSKMAAVLCDNMTAGRHRIPSPLCQNGHNQSTWLLNRKGIKPLCHVKVRVRFANVMCKGVVQRRVPARQAGRHATRRKTVVVRLCEGCAASSRGSCFAHSDSHQHETTTALGGFAVVIGRTTLRNESTATSDFTILSTRQYVTPWEAATAVRAPFATKLLWSEDLRSGHRLLWDCCSPPTIHSLLGPSGCSHHGLGVAPTAAPGFGPASAHSMPGCTATRGARLSLPGRAQGGEGAAEQWGQCSKGREVTTDNSHHGSFSNHVSLLGSHTLLEKLSLPNNWYLQQAYLSVSDGESSSRKTENNSFSDYSATVELLPNQRYELLASTFAARLIDAQIVNDRISTGADFETFFLEVQSPSVRFNYGISAYYD
ncbi:hypothetical protein PR048_016159 [Dryococelus australis]|uniref:Uncharacterized protein n=1 Tax=Dryococelus australis TaxID=614101 RepID=A0ABQ9HJ86_9NEOP|nr:hypothetical protein PR048_016159 [Dryococelus australis]